MIVNKFKKELIEIIQNKKKIELKRLILREINEFFRGDVLEYLNSLIHYRNCINCEHWNYGRMYWICNKEHSIGRDCKDISYNTFGRELIPFSDTYANNGCKDYIYYKRNINHMIIKEVDMK